MSAASFVTDGPLLLAAPVAAAAGLLSFLSPCVLPLVPGYLSFVTGLSGADLAAGPAAGSAHADAARADAAHVGSAIGRATADHTAIAAATDGSITTSQTALAVIPVTASPPVTGAAATGPRPGAGTGPLPGRRRTGRVTLGTALFVAGFTTVFVSYGAAFGGLGRWLTLHQVGVTRLLGVVTIVMGLTFAGAFARVPLANREWRIHRLPAPGLLGAPVLGVLFGIGWTPCLGPTLTAVLGLAVQSATAGRGAFLSAAYCLGLGVPFLFVGLAFRRAAGTLAAMRRHARALTVAGGVLLITVGLLEVTGAWTDLIASLQPYAPGFAETPL